MGFLPITEKDMKERGWDRVDFAYVIGDAYVDHPSFGPAIISRVLEAHGYRVGIISQPDWKNPDSIDVFGEPRLGFLVSGGNMDSMVNHYTVSKHRRPTDAYTPGGEPGKRPDRATIVYCNLIRRKYPKNPIIIGGIEASLRRLAHYDYWSDSLKHSILIDSQADLISYGMGERSIVEIADALAAGLDVKDICFVAGTVYKAKSTESVPDVIVLPSFAELKQDKMNYARSFSVQYKNTDPFTAKPMAERYEDFYVIQNPPAAPMTTMELDDIYALPYMRTYHPSYEAQGGVPAIEEIRFSLASCRGCYGGCSFCALTFHQGRIVQARSKESLVEEAVKMTEDPHFKGYIHDVGGPSANFRRPACEKQMKKGVCTEKQCLFPKPCANLIVDHSDYLDVLRTLRELPKVKKVFVRSGIRFDYVMADKDDTFLRELCRYHVSGQLKVAPEHISERVLRLMGKPEPSVYRSFIEKYGKINEQLGMKQYVVPYLMSSHPGSELSDAIEMAVYLKQNGVTPEQVQDFYPTPSTISTCMYYTGVDPRTMKPVYVAKNPHEKAMQRALIQFRNPDNYDLVKEALYKAGRQDLIGFGPECLIYPRKDYARKDNVKKDSTKKDSVRKDSAKKDSVRKDSAKKDSVKKESVRKKDAGKPGKAQTGKSGQRGTGRGVKRSK